MSLLIYGILHAFDTEYETVKIEQNIGGQLICNSVYNADHHSWQYDIDYYYLPPNKDTIQVGSGSYYGREWEKNEQIIKYDDWLILKTGGFHDADKLLIGKKGATSWMEFEISPETIEKDSLWISKSIYSKMNWLPQESFITNFENGIVTVDYLYRTVDYLYRTGEIVDQQEKRTITYKIDKSTGIPEMINIKMKK